jgi:hypothetical protein
LHSAWSDGHVEIVTAGALSTEDINVAAADFESLQLWVKRDCQNVPTEATLSSIARLLFTPLEQQVPNDWTRLFGSLSDVAILNMVRGWKIEDNYVRS